MKLGVSLLTTAGVLLTIAMLTTVGWDYPPIQTIQRGFRGLGMVEVYNPRTVEAQQAQNQLPEITALEEPIDETPASEVYENVQVLGALGVDRFNRLMTDLTTWVSPDQGCAYCHGEEGNFAEDALYTKVVARRMLQMTEHINATWGNHVKQTGVTCYTCHRGKPVPAYTWFKDPGPERVRGSMAGNRADQNAPASTVGYTSLPYDPLTLYLEQDANIRVISTEALPTDQVHGSIKQTEATYGLMMHMSTSLGVNCTYCHNSRSFFAWDQSTPQRSSAWYGIRMVRGLNNEYLVPLAAQLPKQRLGPLGDGPKVNCGTCHQGAFKPLYGASMLKEYPELAGPVAAAAPAAAPAEAPAAPAAPAPAQTAPGQPAQPN